MVRASTCILVWLLLSACSSGVTALRQGDYDAAVAKAAHRFRQKPTHKHARFVLAEAFQLAYNRHQQTIQAVSQSQEPFRWERAVPVYERLQQTTDIARQSGLAWAEQYPASYAQNLTDVRRLAAADRYEAAEQAYQHREQRLEAARAALTHYERANAWVNGYRDACAKAAEVLPYAIVRVVVELPVPSRQLSRAENRQLDWAVFKRIGGRWAPAPLSRIYVNDSQAGEGYPIHQVVRMRVSSYSPQWEQTSQSCITVESDQTYVVGKKKINDSTEVEIKEKVKGVLTTHRRTLSARLNLRLQAIDQQADCIAWEDELTRYEEWSTEWQTFAGDERALNGHSLTTASLFVPSASEFLDKLIDGMAQEIRTKLRRQYD